RLHGEGQVRRKTRARERASPTEHRLSWSHAFVGYAARALRSALPAFYWPVAIAATILGTTLGAVIARGLFPSIPISSTWLWIAGLVVGIPIGWMAALIATLAGLGRVLFHEVPRNFYGVCTGRAGERSDPGAPALTDWLHRTLNDLAGLAADGPPLTIGQLAFRGIRLQMVSTNISLGEPFLVPLEPFYVYRED